MKYSVLICTVSLAVSSCATAPHTFLASELKSDLISTLAEIVSQVEKD